MSLDWGRRQWQLKSAHWLNVVVHLRNLLFQIGHHSNPATFLLAWILSYVICESFPHWCAMSFHQIIARRKNWNVFSTWRRLEFSNMHRVLGYYLWWDWCVKLCTISILGRLLENLKYSPIEDGDNVNPESTLISCRLVVVCTRNLLFSR